MIPFVFAALLSLDDVERAALARAPVVAQARAVVVEKAALLDAARGVGVPHAFATYTNLPQGEPTGNLVQQLTTVGGSITLGDIVGVSADVAQARADVRSAQAAEVSAERMERVKVIGLYVDAVRTAEVERVRSEILRATRADRRAAALRFSSGDAPRLDVVRADVAVARASADFAQAHADAQNAHDALTVEIGVQSDAVLLPDFARLTPSLVNAPSVDDALQTAFRNRPEVAVASADVASEEAAVRAAHRAVLPGLTAQAGYAKGIDTGVPVSGPSANVSLDIPLGGAAADRARAEEARLVQARSRLDEIRQNVTVEVAAALRTYAADREASEATARARAEAAQEVQAAVVGYRNGASSSLDVLDARRTFAQAQIDDVSTRAALYEASSTLLLLLGVQE